MKVMKKIISLQIAIAKHVKYSLCVSSYNTWSVMITAMLLTTTFDQMSEYAHIPSEIIGTRVQNMFN